jgi:alpha/beta superfamily hydrolase
MIPGPVGALEALFEWQSQQDASAAALVCHPHPLYGGTMHNKVVYRAAKAAIEAGLPTLRFNFRGVGKSMGTYDDGLGEREDVRAALDYLEARFPGLPICLLGFSFGAWVGLQVGASDLRVQVLVGLGTPVGTSDMAFLRSITKPKLFVQGTRDEFGPRPELEAFFNSLAEPKRLVWVEDADHFFTGKLERMQAAVRAFLQKEVPGPPPARSELGPEDEGG